MPAMLTAVRGRRGLVAVIYGLFSLGVCIPAHAESDAYSLAPWQAPSNGQDYLGVPSSPLRPRGHQIESVCGSEGECGNDADAGCANNGGCDFSNPWTCGLGSLFERDRLWFRGEYLMWWGKSANLPAMASTSVAGTSYADSGVLGKPGTSVLFGGAVDTGAHSGVRLALGYWLSPCHDLGLEAIYFSLGNNSADFNQTSDGSTILARPFYNTATGLQDAVVLAYPGIQSGSINVGVASELSSMEVLVRRAMIQQDCQQLDFLFGYRYGRFNEDLSVSSTSTYASEVGQLPVGTVVNAADVFSGHNEFNGAEFGFASNGRCGRFSMELLTKLAIGAMRSRATVHGSTVIREPDSNPISYPTNGVLALGSNSGDYEQTELAFIPELGINVGYDITCRLRATAGYTLMYWSRVARPGDEIDTNINGTQIPPGTLSGAALPQFKFVTSDYWTQGLSLGLDYRF